MDYGYMRVSTEEQSESGAGLGAQEEAILRYAPDVLLISETASAKDLQRPQLAALLDEIVAGDRLIVAKLDRLSRSLADFADILARARKQEWKLVALDLGVDTSTPTGELVANVMMAVAQWERRIIGQRTKEALAEKRRNGVRLGRPPVIDSETRELVLTLRGQGMTYRAISEELENERIAAPSGGYRWSLATIAALCKEERP